MNDDVRERSKRLFGNSYVLEVCAALADVPDRTTLTALIGDSGLSPSVYSGPLRRLRGLGLIVADAHPDDDHRERWFRPADTRLWETAKELRG
jgi:hypothetical protein